MRESSSGSVGSLPKLRLCGRWFALIFSFSVFCVPRLLPGDDVAARYDAIIRTHIEKDYPGMLRAPTGAITHPFIVPGSVYSSQLWDWDSWFCSVALTQILQDEKGDHKSGDALSYGEGCVLTFLDYAAPDGSIPICVQDKADPKIYASANADETNTHKPVLAQHAAFLTKLNHGDAEWLRSRFPKLQAFIQNYDDHRKNKPTGLYYWNDDVAIGVDNDPSTFFRPHNSSGSIFLNCLMYKELTAMAYLATCLKLDPAIADKYLRESDVLKAAVRRNCWDERDGFYYSVDLDLLPVTHQPGTYMGFNFVLHAGHPRDYDCLIQRIEGWSGLMAMWAGIATPEQARRMLAEHIDNPKTLGSRSGVRSLSQMEKMYGIYSSDNPSNWDGPVWIVANYLLYRGLLNYGWDDQARVVADKTISLLARDYEKTNTLHEYYNPDDGSPMANKDFQDWNYLVLNMLDWTEGRPVVAEF